MHQELEQAILVLEAHRHIVGNEVVETAVSALREKLFSLLAYPTLEQPRQITVLVADMSGFTAMSEMMDAEVVRDTINAIWQKLDSVIESWDGRIDKHVGDSVLAFFGLNPVAGDAPERAALAALDMQMELALFRGDNDETQHLGQQNVELHMRIGISTGPLMFGKVGSNGKFTAIGDTLSIAHQLEKLAPVDGILIDDEMYNLVRPYFKLEPFEPTIISDEVPEGSIFALKRQRRHAFRDAVRSASIDRTRFVGREAPLEQLQFALESVRDSGALQMITVMGAAGIGKSRLYQEFEKWLGMTSQTVALFKGRARRIPGQRPYALMYELFADFFDIHPQSSATVAREKLVRGILGVLQEDGPHARERAHFIGQLLGFDFTNSPYLQEVLKDAQRIRDFAFQDMARFFQAISGDRPVILILDNLEWADEGSLDLLEYLIDACNDKPILIIGLSRPDLYQKRPSWRVFPQLDPYTFSLLEVEPLSPIDSRHLVTENLQEVSRPPLRLVDVIVDGADGNPFYIEELVTMLTEKGIIIKGEKQWRVQLGRLIEIQSRLSLTQLGREYVAQLPELQRRLLGLAAVSVGAFWEGAMLHLAQDAEPPIASGEVLAKLHAMNQQGLIRQHERSLIGDTREYSFRHDILRQIAYDAMAPEQRQKFHASLTQWLQLQPAGAIPEELIAYHLAQAGEAAEAAAWYGRAADQARQAFAPETAIRRYRRALTLQKTLETQNGQRVQLNRALGEMLLQRSRLDEAITAFANMHAAAQAIADDDAAAVALRHLTITENMHGDYRAAYKHAQEAEQQARGGSNTRDRALALVTQGWAQMGLGELKPALELAQEALNISTSMAAAAQREMAFSNALAGNISRIMRRFDEATAATQRAKKLFHDVSDWMWQGVMESNLGRIAAARGDLETAVAHYQESLELARNLGDAYGAVLTLRRLSRLAQQQEQPEQVENYLRQAYIWAERSNYTPFQAAVAIDFGAWHRKEADATGTAVVMYEQWRQARHWFDLAIHLVQDTPYYISRLTAQVGLAQILLEQDETEAALTTLQKGMNDIQPEEIESEGVIAHKRYATAWRVLGSILAELIVEHGPVQINGESYTARDCFEQSYQLLSAIGDGVARETADTLDRWALFEMIQGDRHQGQSLRQQAQEIYAQLQPQNV